jgi:tRNA pseudouridine38-40 synthase
MTELYVRRAGQHIVVSCSANAFLHHMVRNIVGSLVRVGKADERPEWMRTILESGDRRASGMTAPAAGLTLMKVAYPPDSFALPLFNRNELREP